MDEAVKHTGSNPAPGLTALEEKFPRIVKALCELWGKEGYEPYLQSLVFDTRGGRQGFPADVSMELFTLYQLLDYQSEKDVWSESDQDF